MSEKKYKIIFNDDTCLMKINGENVEDVKQIFDEFITIKECEKDD